MHNLGFNIWRLIWVKGEISVLTIGGSVRAKGEISETSFISGWQRKSEIGLELG